MSVVPLADIKSDLKIAADASDARIQAKIEAAEAALSRLLGGAGALSATAVTQRVTGCRPTLMLSRLPVISVESVTDSSGNAIDLSTLDIDEDHGLIYMTGGTFTDPFYTVGYHTGYASLDADLVEAVKLLTKHFWETQRGPTARPSTQQSTPNPTPGGFPPRVLEIVANRTAPGFA